MKSIINEDYLLNSMQAKVLYNKYAKNLPIIDYHCHLNPKDIYEDRVYEDICRLSLVDGNYGDQRDHVQKSGLSHVGDGFGDANGA